MVVNGTTGYTGIGTGNPFYPLDIVGNVRWSGSLIGGNVSWASLTNFPSACNAGEAVQVINSTLTCIPVGTGNVSGVGTPNYIPIWTTPTTMSDSVIFQNGTKIGIGTGAISLSKTLDVVGDINATVGIYGVSIYQNGNSVLDTSSSFGGNVTGTNSSLNLAANSVDSAKIVDYSIASADIANEAVGTGQIANASINADKIAAGAVNTTHILDGTILGADIANGAITSSKLVADLDLNWANLTDYPAACSAGQAMQAINDTAFTCVTLNSTSGNISGTGTQNYVAKFTSSDKLGNSQIFDNGTTVGIGTSGNAAIRTLDVVGDINATAGLYAANGLTVSGGTVTLPAGEIGNAELANSSLTVTAGSGLTDGGLISLGGTGTLNIGAGTGIVVNADNVSINTTIVPRKDQTETISGVWTFSEDATFSKNLRVAGNITYVNSETLNVNGSIIPPLDGWFDIGSITNRWKNIYGLTLNGSTIYQGANQVLDRGTSFGGNVSGVWNALQLASGSVGNSQLINNAVDANKLAVTISLGSGQSITSGAGTLNASHLNGQTSSYFLNTSTSFGGNVSGTYNSMQLASNSVGSGQIINGAINSSKLVDDLGLGWNNLTDYPADCGSGEVVKGLADGSFTCTPAGTGNISGAGNVNILAKFTGASTIANSTIIEVGGLVGINTTSPQNTLEVVGTLNVTTGNSILTLTSNGDLTFGI